MFYIVLIILTIIIIFYGGKNSINLVEYDSNFFENFKNIVIFEKKLQNYDSKFEDITNNDSDYITINEINNTSNIILPNYVNNFFIKIKSYSYFDIKKVVDITMKNNFIMIIFNHNNDNNIELIVNR